MTRFHFEHKAFVLVVQYQERDGNGLSPFFAAKMVLLFLQAFIATIIHVTLSNMFATHIQCNDIFIQTQWLFRHLEDN